MLRANAVGRLRGSFASGADAMRQATPLVVLPVPAQGGAQSQLQPRGLPRQTLAAGVIMIVIDRAERLSS